MALQSENGTNCLGLKAEGVQYAELLLGLSRFIPITSTSKALKRCYPEKSVNSLGVSHVLYVINSS
jgi:hypothetical protein